METSNYKLCHETNLRPGAYNNITTIYKIVCNEGIIFKADIGIVDALNMKRGDTCYIRCKAEFDDNHEYIDVYMDGEMLSEFISKFGMEHINCSFVGEFEAKYGTYSTYDPYINDAEVYGYKLKNIVEFNEEDND